MNACRSLAWGVAVACVLAHTYAWGENWGRFRGANGEGRADAAELPTEWTADDYAWRAALPGLGHSSPVVWHGRVYVTSADADSGEQILLAFDAADGRELWQQRWPVQPHLHHATNSFATPTPAVDKAAVYVAWKSADDVHLAARSHDGAELWSRRVAHLDEDHGYGTSPIVVGDVVVLDHQTAAAEDSCVMGFDRRTGETLWTVPRAPGKTTYATPCVWTGADKPLVIAASMGAGVTAIDPASGKVAWNALAKDLPDRCVSSPLLADGMAYVSCGSGNNGLHLVALRLPKGDQTEAREAFRVTKGVPNIPTPIVTRGLLILWHDRGTVSCVDAATGEAIWTRRLGGKFHSSPLLVGNRIYGISLDGKVHVLAAEREFRLLGTSDLGEPVTATPAIADGRMFIRTEKSLLCLAAK